MHLTAIILRRNILPFGNMRYINFLHFNIYHIQLFLSLAENLNYTKTADESGITQSTLSRIIIQLENLLGIQLFFRDTSKVALTPAGMSLYKDMKSLYGHVEDAVQKAYRIQNGKRNLLNIGISDGMNISEELLPFLKQFQKEHPDFEVFFSRDYDYKLMPKLKDHIYDVIFDFTVKDIDDSSINEKSFFSGPLMLYMLESNPLCKKEKLTISDLRDQCLLVRSPSLEPDGIELIRKMFANQGIEPLFSTFVANALDMSLNIRNDNEAILADRFYIDRYSPFLRVKEIENTNSTIKVRWFKDFSENKDTDLFVKEMIKYFDSQSQLDKNQTRTAI